MAQPGPPGAVDGHHEALVDAVAAVRGVRLEGGDRRLDGDLGGPRVPEVGGEGGVVDGVAAAAGERHERRRRCGEEGAAP